VLAAGLVGVGFGLSYSFITQGILGALSDEERAIGGAGIATARLTGAAAGSAMAAAVANLAGFAQGFSPSAARIAGVWVFLAALPLAALAFVCAWHMGKPHASPFRAVLRGTWRRYRSRNELTRLNPAMLKDIGITGSEAEHEANKPFWRK